MPLIVTPRQLTRRAELYHQLAGVISAGVPIIDAIEMVRRNPPSRSFVKPLTHILQKLQSGSTFHEALCSTGLWLPSFDLALMQAGEQSGRLDASFRLLANYYAERAQLARNVLSELGYPVFVGAIALLIFPTSLLINLVLKGDVMGYVEAKAMISVPVILAVSGLLYACQGSRGQRWRSWIERIMGKVPILAAARRSLALARLTAALEALINAGVSIIEAWDLAAAASGSPRLQRVVAEGKPSVLKGETPADMISRSKVFPDLFASMYKTGEISGQLDSTLRRLHDLYQEEASRKLKMAAQWFPRLFYLGMMIMVAYQVVAFYSGYFNAIGQAAQ